MSDSPIEYVVSRCCCSITCHIILFFQEKSIEKSNYLDVIQYLYLADGIIASHKTSS